MLFQWFGMLQMREMRFHCAIGLVVLCICASLDRGVTRGGKGGTIPPTKNHYGGAESLRGRRKVTAMSQVLSSIQCICFRKTSGSNMGAPTHFLATGAIQLRYAPAFRQSIFCKGCALLAAMLLFQSRFFTLSINQGWTDLFNRRVICRKPKAPASCKTSL